MGPMLRLFAGDERFLGSGAQSRSGLAEGSRNVYLTGSSSLMFPHQPEGCR